MSEIAIKSQQIIHYKLIPGKTDLPYLVFLHEGLGCIEMWKGFPQLLCDKTECPGLVYDRIGYGKSSEFVRGRSFDYLKEYALQELPDVLHQIIPKRDFILIGHSDGGSIGLIYAGVASSRLRGLITEAAHVFVDDETVSGIKAADSAWENGKLDSLFRYHGDKTAVMFKTWTQIWLSTEYKNWNIEDLLAKVKVPLLAIQGADDHYGSIRQLESIVRKTTSVAQREIIESCGHSPHLEAQQKVLELMSEFVYRAVAN